MEAETKKEDEQEQMLGDLQDMMLKQGEKIQKKLMKEREREVNNGDESDANVQQEELFKRD